MAHKATENVFWSFLIILRVLHNIRSLQRKWNHREMGFSPRITRFMGGCIIVINRIVMYDSEDKMFEYKNFEKAKIHCIIASLNMDMRNACKDNVGA